ncbi:MAG: GIY-YIG nuclease family protein, partial [Deltaproteobacteria bacterium]|nr:GIY-YIG nuclease family protein [Deltaproteobacteria bacterium]
MLQSHDGLFYTGYTTNLDRRLKEHQSGSPNLMKGTVEKCHLLRSPRRRLLDVPSSTPASRLL